MCAHIQPYKIIAGKSLRFGLDPTPHGLDQASFVLAHDQISLRNLTKYVVQCPETS